MPYEIQIIKQSYRQTLKSVLIDIKILVVGISHRETIKVAQRLKDADKLTSLRIRQGLQKNCVDEGEDGGVCTDSETQNQDRDDREPRGF